MIFHLTHLNLIIYSIIFVIYELEESSHILR